MTPGKLLLHTMLRKVAIDSGDLSPSWTRPIIHHHHHHWLWPNTLGIMTIRLALFTIYFFSLLSSSIVYAAASTWPAPIPLFHKSPYFNAWIDASSNVSSSPVPRWPHFLNITVLIFFASKMWTLYSRNGVARNSLVQCDSSRRY